MADIPGQIEHLVQEDRLTNPIWYEWFLSLFKTKIAAVRPRKFTGSGTYTPSAGTVYCVIECVGGGGSGGSTNTTGAGQTCVSSGGGGGGYASLTVSSTAIGAGIAVTVGAGGAPVGAGLPGNAGGTSSAGGCVATGGGGGPAGGVGAASFALGATGGIGTAGDVVAYGQPSQMSMAITSPNPNGFASHGGASARGYGGGGRAILNGAGEAGGTYGGGGGGNFLGASNPAQAGGAGGVGIVIITEYGSK